MTDSNFNLELGLSKKIFEKWACFKIEGISENDLIDFIFTKASRPNDVDSLLDFNFQELEKRNIEKVSCNFNVEFARIFDSPKILIEIIKKIQKKYQKMYSEFYVLLNSDRFVDSDAANVFSLLGNGDFAGITLGGFNFQKSPEKFERFYLSAKKLNKKVRIDFSLTEDNVLDLDILQKVKPNEIIGNSIFNAEYFLQNKDLIKENNIKVIFTPENSQKQNPEFLQRIQKLKDSGINVGFGSGNYLFNEVELEDFEFSSTSLSQNAKP